MRRLKEHFGAGGLLTVFFFIWILPSAVVTAQDTPFGATNPFQTSGERPIRLFGDGGPPASFPQSSEGDTVLWSVVVEKKENVPLDNLDGSVFTLRVDGKKQDIAWFSRRPAGEGDQGFAAPGWYVALFDLTVADPLMMKEAGARLLEEIDSRLDQDERVAVVFFDGRVEVAAPFTRDKEVIRAALQRLPEKSVYSIHDFFGSRVRVTARGELNVTSTLDQSDDTAQHNFASLRFFTEIRRLALELGQVPGRKQVMLFSGGYNRRLLGKEDVAYLRMVDAMCRATAVVYTYNAVSDDYLKRVLEEEGLHRKRQEKAGGSELKYPERFLRDFAESTGGRYWTAEKTETAEIVRTLFREGRHHYLLGFPRGTGARTGIYLPCEAKAGGGASEVRGPLGFYDN